jgi:NAD+ kinase
MRFNTIGIVGKYGVADIVPQLCQLADFLRAQGINVVIEEETLSRYSVEGYESLARARLAEHCDLIIVMGGDGTFLHAARDFLPHHQTMLGINLGRLGFLTDIPPGYMEQCLTEMLAGNYTAEKRRLLASAIVHEGVARKHGAAMNDVVIHKWDVARMIEFETRVNGRFVDRQRSDGLIISTPTGSTAYALSGGGPLIDPSVEVMCLVSICPHTLSSRPLVIHGDSRVEILVVDESPSKAQVTCDGQMNLGLVSGDSVWVELSEDYVELIHPPDYNIYRLWREKLGWSGKMI